VSITDGEDIVTRLLPENEKLKFVLERERNNLPREVRDINILENYLQRIEEKIEKMQFDLQDNFQEKLHSAGKVNLEKFAELENKMANIEKLISKFL